MDSGLWPQSRLNAFGGSAFRVGLGCGSTALLASQPLRWAIDAQVFLFWICVHVFAILRHWQWTRSPT